MEHAEEATLDGVRVLVTRSAGDDHAYTVFVDTDFEPDGSDDSPGLRVYVNESDVYVGVPYSAGTTW